MSTPEELWKTLGSYKWLRVYWDDYTSTTRCRLLPIQEVGNQLMNVGHVHIPVPAATLSMLATERVIPGAETSGIYILLPDWSSLKPGPVEGHISCYGEFRNPDGTKMILCPRTFLQHTLDAAASLGLTYKIGFEIGFVAMKRCERGTYYPLRHHGLPGSMARALTDWGQEGAFTTVVDKILMALQTVGIPFHQFHVESTGGHYTLALSPRLPMESCDNLLHTRRIIESVSAQHGYSITFHPKPFDLDDECLYDETMYEPRDTMCQVHLYVSSPAYNSFYAAILKHFRAICAFTSHLLSYRLLPYDSRSDERWICWGTHNEETPLSKCEDGHWLLRPFDGLANPYIAISVILAVGTNGIIKESPLTWHDCKTNPTNLDKSGQKKHRIVRQLPKRFEEAMEALKADEELLKLLHPMVAQHYINVKDAELGEFKEFDEELYFDDTNRLREWIFERY